MRKRNIPFLIDSFFWLIMWLLPVLFYLFNTFAYDLTADTMTLSSFSAFIVDNFGISSSSTIYTTLVTIFSNNNYIGVIDANISNSLILYTIYIFFIEMIHIFVDVLLFIPRFAHNFIAKFQEVTND